MQSPTPPQLPLDRIDGDPGAGWRKLARYGATVYSASVFVLFYHGRFRCFPFHCWTNDETILRTLLNWPNHFPIVLIGPTLIIFGCPLMLKPGPLRRIAQVFLAVLAMPVLLPLYSFLYRDVCDSSNSAWSLGFLSLVSFVMVFGILAMLRLRPIPRLFFLEAILLIEAFAALLIRESLWHSATVKIGAGGAVAVFIGGLGWFLAVRKAS